jgi:hypothetical protein
MTLMNPNGAYLFVLADGATQHYAQKQRTRFPGFDLSWRRRKKKRKKKKKKKKAAGSKRWSWKDPRTNPIRGFP